jgi:hypothetical protein
MARKWAVCRGSAGRHARKPLGEVAMITDGSKIINKKNQLVIEIS